MNIIFFPSFLFFFSNQLVTSDSALLKSVTSTVAADLQKKEHTKIVSGHLKEEVRVDLILPLPCCLMATSSHMPLPSPIYVSLKQLLIASGFISLFKSSQSPSFLLAPVISLGLNLGRKLISDALGVQKTDSSQFLIEQSFPWLFYGFGGFRENAMGIAEFLSQRSLYPGQW